MDERKDVFQDEFTENQSKYKGATREEIESSEKLDPDVNSQEADETMAEDRYKRDKTQP